MIVQNELGMIYLGRSALELVKQMRDDCDDNFEETIASYMDEMAHRVDHQSGDIIRTVSPEAFIDDLIKAGYMKRLSIH